MSIKVMSYVWDIPLFKGSDKLVMLCLADHSDDTGFCWPSIETIARKSGVSATTVKSTLKKLEAAGWVVKKNQFKKADSGRLVRANNQYQLPVMLLKSKAEEPTNVEASTFVHSKGEHSTFEQTTQADGMGQITTGGRAGSDYKPPVDPPIESSDKDRDASEPATDSHDDPIAFNIPLKGQHHTYTVRQSELYELRDLYPSVDIAQQLRNMIGWCQANPTRQKTRSGIKRFIHAWLCREQDKGHSAQPSPIQKRAAPNERCVIKQQIRQLEMDIHNENVALMSFQKRKSAASQEAAKSSDKKIQCLMIQRDELLVKLRSVYGE